MKLLLPPWRTANSRVFWGHGPGRAFLIPAMDGNASCLGLPDGSVFAVADVVSTTNVVKRRGRNVLLSRETTKARKASTALGVLFGLVFWMVWFRGSIMINPRPSKIIHNHPRSNDQASLKVNWKPLMALFVAQETPPGKQVKWRLGSRGNELDFPSATTLQRNLGEAAQKGCQVYFEHCWRKQNHKQDFQ